MMFTFKKQPTYQIYTEILFVWKNLYWVKLWFEGNVLVSDNGMGNYICLQVYVNIKWKIVFKLI